MKTLFVDFDGTLCHDRFWRSLPSAECSAVQKFLFQNNSALVDDWMRGKYSSEEITLHVAKSLGLPYERLWDVFVTDCKSMSIDLQNIEHIQELRKTFATVLITGNMDCFDRFTVPTLGLHEYFDTIVNSYNEGALKTDENGMTFKKYLKGEMSDAILIEDSLKSCEVFSSLGGVSLQVQDLSDTDKHLLHLLRLNSAVQS